MDMNEITTEINRLECADTTYSNCDKLATLYTVRNGLAPHEEYTQKVIRSYSYATSPNSDFVRAFQSVPIEYALNVLDEHMEAIRALYPREYRALMKKLTDIQNT